VNSGVVTAVFPATGDGSYTSANIGTLKYVPVGRFQRDGTATNISVITQPYRISQYEITRAQFEAIMGTDPSNITYSTGVSDPVQRVNWYQAIAFANKLSLNEGLTPVYAVSGITDWATLTYASIPTSNNATWDAATATWTSNGYRLPTEMEWIWAAMGAPADGQGGDTNTTGYTKAFAGSTGSNVVGDYAVFGYYGLETGRTTTARSNPVGSKIANELGLYDMSGNVNEWTWDWWTDVYPTGTLTNYRGPATGMSRIRHGMTWLDDGMSLGFVAGLYRSPPDSKDFALGFRLVRL